MARRVFFSFDFAKDFWRTQQVRNINALHGQTLATPNAWEQLRRKGDVAIKKWIADNMHGKSCVVVLVGSRTANRRWVIHEISKGWNDGKGVLGIRINKLLDSNGKNSVAGPSPFGKVFFTGTKQTLVNFAPLKVPAGSSSRAAYASIANNIEAWIEEAIRARSNA